MFLTLWLRSCSAKKPYRHAPRPRTRLTVESLETRDVPSTLIVSDVTVREGPTASAILDPAGAASVGLSAVRGIAFDTGPGDAHYGDLFVTGSASDSVARFDWATQTYQPFVTSGIGGLGDAVGVTVGPDGNVYVSTQNQSAIFRYDGATGAPLPAPSQTGAVYVNANAGGLKTAGGIKFGADGNLYVCSRDSGTRGQILEYQGPSGPAPGAFLRAFVNISTGSAPSNLTFGPDGNLYVSLNNMNDPDGVTLYGQINDYNGSTGAPIGTGVFVPQILQPRDIVFDPTGATLYVVECRTQAVNRIDVPGPMGQILRFQGPSGQHPGSYVDDYVTSGQGGLMKAVSLASDAAGNLYAGDRDSANVTRFAPISQAPFTVTLNTASPSPVTVNYATADGTAAAGTDYIQTSGTLTFAPGETSKTVTVPIATVLTGGPTKTFALNLSSATGATVADSQGIGSILNRMTKFFVADDGSSDRTYEYGSGGTSEEITLDDSGNTASRGAATTAAGTTVWVVDANKTVYVYTNHGVLLGSWTAGSLTATADVQGITVWGSDVWLVDAKQDKVYRYAGAASRLSGSQNATSSFALNGSNTSPKDLVTDGTNIWVVNDSTTDKVFKYTLTGSLVGSWTTGGGGSPTGITLDPNGASQDLWVVDNATDKVYEYAGARSRTSGSAVPASTFALNPFDTNPQGIADPPVPESAAPTAFAAVAVNSDTIPEASPAAGTSDQVIAELSPAQAVAHQGRPTIFGAIAFAAPIARSDTQVPVPENEDRPIPTVPVGGSTKALGNQGTTEFVAPTYGFPTDGFDFSLIDVTHRRRKTLFV